MIGSRGFDYKKKFNPHGGSKLSCKCEFVPGIQGETKVDGYDRSLIYRKWKRVESSSVYAEWMSSESIDKVLEEAETIDETVKNLFRAAKKSNNYDGAFYPFFDSISGDGTIVAQRWAKMQGKEVQVCSWLAKDGHDIEFLLPSNKKGDRTPDIRLDGELWEIKRITSTNTRKVKSRISDGLNQSGSVIVDLSCNEDPDAAASAAIEMLEDKRASKIMVVCKGIATLYSK